MSECVGDLESIEEQFGLLFSEKIRSLSEVGAHFLKLHGKRKTLHSHMRSVIGKQSEACAEDIVSILEEVDEFDSDGEKLVTACVRRQQNRTDDPIGKCVHSGFFDMSKCGVDF